MNVVDVLRGHHHLVSGQDAPPVLLMAGATGALGNAVLQRLTGSPRYPSVDVLAREAIRPGLRSVRIAVREGERIADWPLLSADTGIVLFDPPRLHYQRERALWTPKPEQLPDLATWMQRCGVKTMAIVLPHDQGRLPRALQQGLANLDEQAVAALGFDRLLIVRSAVKPAAPAARNLWQRLANLVLSGLAYMLPHSQSPVRASKVAELVDLALREMPPGIHIAPAELVWRCSQSAVPTVVQAWLKPQSPG